MCFNFSSVSTSTKVWSRTWSKRWIKRSYYFLCPWPTAQIRVSRGSVSFFPSPFSSSLKPKRVARSTSTGRYRKIFYVFNGINMKLQYSKEIQFRNITLSQSFEQIGRLQPNFFNLYSCWTDCCIQLRPTLFKQYHCFSNVAFSLLHQNQYQCDVIETLQQQSQFVRNMTVGNNISSTVA